VEGWTNSDIIFRLGVLGFAAAVVPTIVRRRVGGGLPSYLALTAGLMVLLIGQSNELLKAAMPGWWNSPTALSAYLPTHAGGVLLIFVGFLSLMRDLRRARLQTEETAAQNRAWAEQAHKVKAELERANEELARLATTDYLTGLINRRQAVLLLEHEILRTRRSGKPVSVVLMDLDHFKIINDTHGHEAGDDVLRHVANTMRIRLRASDVIARYGGEEFLLVLPESNLEGAAKVAEGLRRCLYDTPAMYGDVTIRVSSSFGVAVLEPRDEQGCDALVRMADEAMYCAKNLGGNRVVTWNLVREGQMEPSLAASREVLGLEKRVEAIAQHTDEVVLEDIFRLVGSLDARSPYSRGQSWHVALYATAIAREMGLLPEVVEVVYRAAMLRDIGRNAISSEVLWKAGPLSKAEWAIVCQHPVVSIRVLSRLKFLQEEPVIIRHHHERLDGRGYPDGLSGEAIPLESRILAAAEALEAMTRARPHRPALTLADALQQLRGGAPQQFDPAVVAAAERAAAKAADWPLAAQPDAAVVVPERN